MAAAAPRPVPQIGEQPGQQPERQHPERAVRQGACPLGELLREGAALAERLQRRKTLHAVEELFSERSEGRSAVDRGALVGVMDQHWQSQRREGGDEHDRGRRHVPPGQHS